MTLHLDDTDPVPLVLAHLGQDQRLTALLAAAGGHVDGDRRAPWPCLEVRAGSDNPLSVRAGLVASTVEFDLHEAFDNATGPWMLRRILKAAVAATVTLADLPHTDPAQPIVTGVDASGSIYEINTTAGQKRLNTSVTLYMAPAQVPSVP